MSYTHWKYHISHLRHLVASIWVWLTPPTLKRWALLISHIIDLKWPITIYCRREAAKLRGACWEISVKSMWPLTDWKKQPIKMHLTVRPWWCASSFRWQEERAFSRWLFKSNKYKCSGSSKFLRSPTLQASSAKDTTQLQQFMAQNGGSKREAPLTFSSIPTAT